jgi:hypothetical protein
MSETRLRALGWIEAPSDADILVGPGWDRWDTRALRLWGLRPGSLAALAAAKAGPLPEPPKSVGP